MAPGADDNRQHGAPHPFVDPGCGRGFGRPPRVDRSVAALAEPGQAARASGAGAHDRDRRRRCRHAVRTRACGRTGPARCAGPHTLGRVRDRHRRHAVRVREAVSLADRARSGPGARPGRFGVDRSRVARAAGRGRAVVRRRRHRTVAPPRGCLAGRGRNVSRPAHALAGSCDRPLGLTRVAAVHGRRHRHARPAPARNADAAVRPSGDRCAVGAPATRTECDLDRRRGRVA